MAIEDKGEAPKKAKYIFKVDYPVGTTKKGQPKKVYKKGDSYELDEKTADYLISKNVIK